MCRLVPTKEKPILKTLKSFQITSTPQARRRTCFITEYVRRFLLADWVYNHSLLKFASNRKPCIGTVSIIRLLPK